MVVPPIYFYLPACYWPAELPTHSSENWAGFGLGLYAWTLQTYLRLREAGLPCHLTGQLPEQGIVLFHSNAVRSGLVKPGGTRLLVCLKAEAPPCDVAQLHVVQNPREVRRNTHFIPHWPQPGLLPRDPARGEQFDTVAFLGHERSLDPMLRTSNWVQQLTERRFRWVSIANTNDWNDYGSINNRWNDYRQIDAVVAIRRVHVRYPGYFNKPPTKLYNAWLASVPAILGKESAYRAVGKVGLNYLEANSVLEVLVALGRLRHSAELRRSIVAAGQVQAVAYQPDAITQRWQQFLRRIAVPAYNRWCGLNKAQRQISLLSSGSTN
ncbi:MAG: hypothetical protein AAFU71_10015 [Cyanobacteria bacterium J06632_22]